MLAGTYEADIQKARELLANSTYSIALTGAGISTPSGIPDFRSPGTGAWEQADPMEVASISSFLRKPDAFYAWMHSLTSLILEAKPNAAHTALAQLEANGPLKGVITQNIDMLHTRAGSVNVHEVHGHMREATCMSCYRVYNTEKMLADFVETAVMPLCDACQGVMKPNVVLFGEMLPTEVIYQAERQLDNCDLMLVAGSSLTVNPIGDMPLRAKQAGARLIIINLMETHVDPYADLVFHADVVDVLPRLAANFV